MPQNREWSPRKSEDGGPARPGRSDLWLIRTVALVALIATLWFVGPRAWTVLAKSGPGVEEAAGPTVQLDRVGFRSKPSWLDDRLLVAVMTDLAPRLDGEVHLLDEPATGALKERLEASPWIDRARLRRVFPDRLAVDLELRRPVIEVRASAGALRVLSDGQGTCLPAVIDTGLPHTVVTDSGASSPNALFGRQHPDPRVTAAAAVAAEWRDELAPLVDGAPLLVEVDAGNLDYRLFGDGRWSEVLVGVAGDNGASVYLAYGHPPGSGAPRVPIRTKAEILSAMLQEFPGLRGIDRGDLRFANRWRDWLRPRDVAGER